MENRKRTEQLRNAIEKGRIGRSPYWRGADVIIRPNQTPKENLAWSHSNDSQVVTGTEELAHSISWLFVQASGIASPFINYLNKYEFYGELAAAANEIITGSEEYSEKDVLLAVLSRLESFEKEWLLMEENKEKDIK